MAATAAEVIEPFAAEEDIAAANLRAAVVERSVFHDVFAPRIRMPLLEWAETRRMLSPEANALAAEAGGPVHYTSSLTPYHREPMAAIDNPRTEFVVCKFPSQDGKTEIINNFIGKRIDLEPGPMLLLQPTKELGQAWSKDRLAPMIRDTPALQGKVRDARSRDSENTIMHKKFPGGHLTIVGSNSAAGLAARPIRDVAVDEVDRCAKSAGTEGDSIRLAFRRASTFRRGKKLLISSPTIKGASRIDDEYQLGTQEEWHVPCPHCGEYQFLKWGKPDTAYGLKWEADKPESAYYVCEACGCVIEEHHKAWMIERGKFIAQNPGAGPRRRSFWKNALASNLVAWRKLVAEWLEVQGKPWELQQFINTVLCELWDPLHGKETKLEGLVERQGIGYPEDGTVPNQVAILTRSVDTQDDRLEMAVWGWADGEESWLIDWELIAGDPGTAEPWRALDQLRKKTYKNSAGVELRPLVTFIDSGGHHAKEVYAYSRARQNDGVYAIKGSSIEGAPLLGKPTRNNSERAILYMVGAFTGKESLATRLVRIEHPGPGYVHLPRWLDIEQMTQFTRMRLITPISKGGRRWVRAKRVWEETGAVEQFVLYVYALAALYRLGPAVTRHLGEIARKQLPITALPTDEPPEDPPVSGIQTFPGERPKPPRPGGYVNRWR